MEPALPSLWSWLHAIVNWIAGPQIRLPLGHSTIALVAFGAFWLWMLVDCLRRERFYLLLKTPWRTKMLWLAVLALFNPLLTAGYALIGRTGGEPKRAGWGAKTLILSAVLVLAVMGISLRMPNVARSHSVQYAGRLLGNRAGEGGLGPLSVAVDTEITAARIEASNNTSSSSSSMTSGRPRFADGRILLVVDAGHDLLDRIAETLPDRLAPRAGEPNRHVQLIRSEKDMIEADGPWDLFAFVELDGVKALPAEKGRRIEAHLKTRLGTQPWEGRSGYSDGSEPPRVTLDWQGTITHRSTTTGVEARPMLMAGRNLAEEIAKAWTKPCEQLADKHGRPTADLPESFYGTGQAPMPQPDFLRRWNATKLYHGHGLMVHGDVYWRIDGDPNLMDTFQAIHDELSEAGWRGQLIPKAAESVEAMRMFGDGVRLEAFQLRDRQRGLRTDRDPRPIYVRIFRPFTREQTQRAVDVLLDEPADYETLAMFEPLMNDRQLDRYRQVLVKWAPRSNRASLSLVKALHRTDEKDEAERRLRKLWLEAKVVYGDHDFRRELERLAKSWKLDGLEDQALSAETMEELGFRRIRHHTEAFDVPVPAHGRAGFYMVDDTRGLQTVCLSAEATPDRSAPYRPVHAITGSYSTYSHSGGYLDNEGWQYHVTTRAEMDGRELKIIYQFVERPDGEGFVVHVTPEVLGEDEPPAITAEHF